MINPSSLSSSTKPLAVVHQQHEHQQQQHWSRNYGNGQQQQPQQQHQQKDYYDWPPIVFEANQNIAESLDKWYDKDNKVPDIQPFKRILKRYADHYDPNIFPLPALLLDDRMVRVRWVDTVPNPRYSKNYSPNGAPGCFILPLAGIDRATGEKQPQISIHVPFYDQDRKKVLNLYNGFQWLAHVREGRTLFFSYDQARDLIWALLDVLLNSPPSGVYGYPVISIEDILNKELQNYFGFEIIVRRHDRATSAAKKRPCYPDTKVSLASLRMKSAREPEDADEGDHDDDDGGGDTGETKKQEEEPLVSRKDLKQKNIREKEHIVKEKGEEEDEVNRRVSEDEEEEESNSDNSDNSFDITGSILMEQEGEEFKAMFEQNRPGNQASRQGKNTTSKQKSTTTTSSSIMVPKKKKRLNSRGGDQQHELPYDPLDECCKENSLLREEGDNDIIALETTNEDIIKTLLSSSGNSGHKLRGKNSNPRASTPCSKVLQADSTAKHPKNINVRTNLLLKRL